MSAQANDYVNEINARIAYELSVKSNDKIEPKLKALAKDCEHETVANVLREHRVEPSYINRQERSNARFNIYAARKVVNVARASVSAATLNHFTHAIVRTALSLEANDTLLTHADAQCACSANAKHSDSKRNKLIKRTPKTVAPSTVTTQSSSSINALQMFSVLTETRDASNAVAYKLNRDSAMTAKLIELVS